MSIIILEDEVLTGLWRYGIATDWRISPQYLSALRSHPIITCLFSEVDVTPPSHYLHQKFLPYQCTTQAYRHPYEPRDWLCSLFQIGWVESSRPYHPSNLDCKSAEDSLWFLNLELVLGIFPNVTATRFWGTSIWSCPMAWTIFRSVKHGMCPAHRCCWSGTWLSVTCINRSSKKPNNESNNSRMSSLELAERIWQDFHGRNPHTLLFNPQMCFPFKCDTVFPTV